MKPILATTAVGLMTAVLAGGALAGALSPEEQIETRQAGYTFMGWNMGKIKANLQGDYNAEQVKAAADTIAAIANSGMGALYGPGTDKDIGDVKTRVKPELFENMQDVGKLAGDFTKAADNLAEVAAGGDESAVKAAFGDLGQACKACHKKYRADD
ncbi:cytochrome c [Thiorhodococcus mannitoliphagus]|uniref:Cytochrome c n=1 Tax=Thiorhodococcus mannitoliphagus TaxID=329406 RepID=A0A6P1DY45_9GAMM|nr:cytochrome c [Thiorhodococcus mannitoliphagus]NEX21921.1 cytochrome c [Thiorhodococcus mannitoliphagus]